MYQLEGHMYIWKQTRICEIASSTILVMSIFSWLSNNEKCVIETNIFHLYYCEHVIYMNNTNSHYAKKLLWIPPLYVVFGSKPYTSHHWIYGCDKLLHHNLLGWVLNDDLEIMLITSSSMVKYLHRCHEILMTRLEVYHSYNHNSQHYVKKIKGWHID